MELHFNIFSLIMDFTKKLIPSKQKAEYIESHVPGFVTKLSKKQSSLHDSALKTQKEWQQKRVCYLRTKLKLDVLREVIEDIQVSRAYQNLTHKDQQKLIEVNNIVRTSGNRIFDGLLSNITHNHKVDDKINDMIKTEMKMKILNTCSELLCHYYSHNEVKGTSSRNPASLYQKSLDLVNLIKNDIHCIDNVTENKISKFDDRNEIDVEKQKKQRLKDHLCVLNQIVDIHLTGSVPKANDTNVEHLAAKVRNFRS